MFVLGKKPAFPNHFCVYGSVRERILLDCVSSYQAIGSTEVFFQKRSDFPGKRQKPNFFCFYRVTKTHKDKIDHQIQVNAWPSG